MTRSGVIGPVAWRVELGSIAVSRTRRPARRYRAFDPKALDRVYHTGPSQPTIPDPIGHSRPPNTAEICLWRPIFD